MIFIDFFRPIKMFRLTSAKLAKFTQPKFLPRIPVPNRKTTTSIRNTASTDFSRASTVPYPPGHVYNTVLAPEERQSQLGKHIQYHPRYVLGASLIPSLILECMAPTGLGLLYAFLRSGNATVPSNHHGVITQGGRYVETVREQYRFFLGNCAELDDKYVFMGPRTTSITFNLTENANKAYTALVHFSVTEASLFVIRAKGSEDLIKEKIKALIFTHSPGVESLRLIIELINRDLTYFGVKVDHIDFNGYESHTQWLNLNMSTRTTQK